MGESRKGAEKMDAAGKKMKEAAENIFKRIDYQSAVYSFIYNFCFLAFTAEVNEKRTKTPTTFLSR
jgi:hypothetical protein